jgi:hypothetical protein
VVRVRAHSLGPRPGGRANVTGAARVAEMALLSQMFRTVAITGRTDTMNAWFADRQGGRWAEQTVRSAFPAAAHAQRTQVATRSPGDPAATLRELTELHRRGVVTDAELAGLRARLGV